MEALWTEHCEGSYERPQYYTRMGRSRKKNPLVNYDPEYYRYPKTVHFGLGENGLNEHQAEFRLKVLTEYRVCYKSDAYRYLTDVLGIEALGETVDLLVARHGSFASRFLEEHFTRLLGAKVAKIQSELKHDKVRDLIDEARGYPYRWNSRISELVSQIGLMFANVGLYLSTERADFVSSFDAWYPASGAHRVCSICSREYRLLDIPYWVYYGSDGAAESCCFLCQLAKPLKKDIPGLVKAFVDSCGFIPSSSSGPIQRSFTRRLSPESRTSVLHCLCALGGIEHVVKKYGSWFKCLSLTGVLPGGVQVTKRGVRCLAQDGHECHSLDEQFIDNWLKNHGIDHEREPYYPKHPLLNPSGRRRADWKVGPFFVEYFGLAGEATYDRKTQEKLELAALCGVELIAIYPSDLRSLDDKLGPLISR